MGDRPSTGSVRSGPGLILGGTGDVLTTLGSPVGEASWGFDRARRIAASDSGHVWIAAMASYEMTRWSIAPDEPRLRVTRRADWFPEGTTYHPGEPYTVEPKPRITDVLEDDDGRLWVSILVADSDWRRRDDPGDIPVDRMNMRELYDSVVEVVEWKDGRRVVASGRFDDAPVSFVDPSGRASRDVLGYTAVRDAYGDVRMMVLRFRP